MEVTKTRQFLEQHIFYDLVNLNDGFDSENIKYFSKEDFEKVLDRAEFFKLEIYGIEPWQNKQFSGVKTYDNYDTTSDDSKWYKKAYRQFLSEGITNYFSASYGLSDKLLELF